MADNTTELEVLDQIVDVLGGTSGQHETVVPVLRQIKELLAAGITDPEAIAEAVDAWLDEHPEATTTVQDGSITGVKIADDTILDAKLAQAVRNRIGRVEYTVGPRATVTVEGVDTSLAFEDISVLGKSVQDGTPTPAAPVAIESIESLSVRVSGSDTSDYSTTEINLGGNILRSLPDGTADALTIASDGTVTLTKRVGVVNLGTFSWASFSSPASHVFRTNPGSINIVKPANSNYAVNAISNGYVAKGYTPLSASDDGCFALSDDGNRLVVIDHRFSDVESFAAAASNFVMQYKLATPETVSLGSVSAIYPPEQVSNVWAVSDPATSVSVTLLQNTVERLSEIDADIDEVRQVSVCKNLVGNVLGEYYPIPKLHVGDKLTFSTSDGLPVATSDTVVDFYDKDRNRLDYYVFAIGQVTRTITVQSSFANTVFLGLRNVKAAQPIQVEFGPTATEYEPYFGNAAYLFNEVERLDDGDVPHLLENARHIPYASLHAPSLTILHMSDVHADTIPYRRILKDANKLSTSIDGMICTGDMVANTYGQISGWWYPDVMTCVGNHDTASYDTETGYDWTALSMADRDEYYIAPFESGWGVTHTVGTSYYYKDYADSHVRLIVMDGMLYMGSATATEAAAQTSWLGSLLSDAITNDLHVLIAIHAPHPGATPMECSFTKYGQTTMLTEHDCNTPQTVIDAVASAITGGLHFIGYLVGHTHIDTIWDAEGDGTQLMYCVTCVTTSVVGSDQYRYGVDAYNLVTIDTYNKLVKIARGGGADIDDKMRPRKAICINYDTGTIVGQTL